VVNQVSQEPIYTTTTNSESGSFNNAMGQDAFLKMFMAQVTNQNPLDPMDNTEYTAQLATFSSLEQLTKIAGSMDAITSLKQTVEQGNIVNYIGKGVTLAGDVLPIAQGYVGKVGYALDQDAIVSVTITDEAGSIVATKDLGRLAAGEQSFQWDAKDNAGELVGDGAYKVTIMAYNDRGDPIEVSNQTVNSLVTGYQKGADGENYLLLGEVALPMSEVLAVYYIPMASGDTEDQTTAAAEMNFASTVADEYKAQAASASSTADGSDEPSFGEKILKSIISLGGLAAALL
jgi:flagellar basal-body rod modification protein FlgD